MLIVVAIYSLTRQHVQALPIPPPTVEERAPDFCNDCRTLWNIVWSCLATIFSCTWVAVHPNIPGPDENGFWTTLGRRLQLTVMALIAPEFVIVWALRQLFVARRLAKQHRKRGWTQAHGFFALMGGFMLFDGDKPLRNLYPKELEPLCQNGEIDFPCITEDEIKDRSKGDILSKGLVIVQTGWFVLQCIARQVEHLPITELELVTLAFATLNFATYGLWWNKPLNVQQPFRIPIKPSSVQEGQVGDEGQGEAEVSGGDESGNGDEDERGGDEGESRDGNEDEARKFGIQDLIAIVRKASATITHTVQGVIAVAHNIPGAIHKMMDAVGFAVRDSVIPAMHSVCSPRVWGEGLAAIIMTFAEMGGATSSTDSPKVVPGFYSGALTENEELLVFGTAGIITIIFGLIHSVAWSFRFPSHAEQLLWRSSSIAIIGLPALTGILALLSVILDYWLRLFWQQLPHQFKKVIGVVGINVIVSAIPTLYILARVPLLVLPFTCLRALPPEAYQTVRWTTFIPHM